MQFTEILKKPNKISKNQISYLRTIIDDFPYLQSARAIYLKALKDSDSFKFHSELKITAAYSTERNVLFDFITSKGPNEIAKVSTDIEKITINTVENIEEKKSFVEWLSISNYKPIDRNVNVDNTIISSASMIDKFIETKKK